eukprot:5429684-Prymnesium_polylepis.1
MEATTPMKPIAAIAPKSSAHTVGVASSVVTIATVRCGGEGRHPHARRSMRPRVRRQRAELRWACLGDDRTSEMIASGRYQGASRS